jgi:hypothetical protein
MVGVSSSSSKLCTLIPLVVEGARQLDWYDGFLNENGLFSIKDFENRKSSLLAKILCVSSLLPN